MARARQSHHSLRDISLHPRNCSLMALALRFPRSHRAMALLRITYSPSASRLFEVMPWPGGNGGIGVPAPSASNFSDAMICPGGNGGIGVPAPSASKSLEEITCPGGNGGIGVPAPSARICRLVTEASLTLLTTGSSMNSALAKASAKIVGFFIGELPPGPDIDRERGKPGWI